MRGGARRPQARRTRCASSVRPRAPTKQLGPSRRRSEGNINALRALAPLPRAPVPGHHTPSPAPRSPAGAAGTAHISLRARRPRPPGCDRDARRAHRRRQAANDPPGSAGMTPRGAARRRPPRPESDQGAGPRGWAGARPGAGHPQVREELPDHGGIVQRGDQAQPAPAMEARQDINLDALRALAPLPRAPVPRPSRRSPAPRSPAGAAGTAAAEVWPAQRNAIASILLDVVPFHDVGLTRGRGPKDRLRRSPWLCSERSR